MVGLDMNPSIPLINDIVMFALPSGVIALIGAVIWLAVRARRKSSGSGQEGS